MREIQKFTLIMWKCILCKLSINVKNALKQITELRSYEEVKVSH
jgi:hypothetical protein